MDEKHRQTIMYLEAIQKLSMYIVRKQKNDPDDHKTVEQASSSDLPSQIDPNLDQDTMMNIKGLMDEHVFELLDKTECRVLQLQRENLELLEELSHFYQVSLTKEEQV